MCLLLALPLPRAFLQWPLIVLARQTRQAVCAIKQSIFSYVYGLNTPLEVCCYLSRQTQLSVIYLWFKHVLINELALNIDIMPQIT